MIQIQIKKLITQNNKNIYLVDLSLPYFMDVDNIQCVYKLELDPLKTSNKDK